MAHITLDLTGFAKRHRARCRELGIPEDTPWPEREERGREKRRRALCEARARRANWQFGLWGATSRLVWVLVLALLLAWGC